MSRTSTMKVDGKRTWFTSDLHFFHNNIIKYCKRPWYNFQEMNEALIVRWNSVVKPGDTVFNLGDLAMGGRSKGPHLAAMLSRMNGDMILIPGNHDTYVLTDESCAQQIRIFPPLFEIKVSDPDAPRGWQRITMCHYAMKIWNKSHHGAWNLYGHSHHSMPPDYSIKAIDVGIDGKGYDYKPLSYAQVKNLMSMHGAETIDHHSKRTNDNF